MRKALLALLAISLCGVVHAQIINAGSVKVKTTTEILWPGKSAWFIGLNAGIMPMGEEEYYGYKHHRMDKKNAILEGGYIGAFSGTLASKFVPVYGASVGMGYGFQKENFYMHLKPFIGLMLGDPSFRLDLSLSPTAHLMDGVRCYVWLEGGIWISHFYLGISTRWPFVDVGEGLMGRIAWIF